MIIILRMHIIYARNLLQKHTEIILKKIEVITGKSGPIRREFPHWAENNHQVQYIENSWHGGSFIIKIQKKF